MSCARFSATLVRDPGAVARVAGNPIRLILGTGHDWTSNPAGMLEPATANERRTTYV